MKHKDTLHIQNENGYYESENETNRYWKTRKSDIRIDKVCANCESQFLNTQCKGAKNFPPCALWVYTQLQTENDPAKYERDSKYIKRRIAYGCR